MVFRSKYFNYGLPVLLLILFLIIVKVQNQPSCTITPAIIEASNVDGSTANLSWQDGQNSKVTYLNVSTSKSLKPDGSFSETADIVNDIVSGKTSFTRYNLSSGTYYWNIVSDSCGQRKVSDLGTFIIK